MLFFLLVSVTHAQTQSARKDQLAVLDKEIRKSESDLNNRPFGCPGVIRQKLDEHTYRFEDPNGHPGAYILRTTSTRFASAGSFYLNCVKLPDKNVELQSGFEQTFTVFKECDSQCMKYYKALPEALARYRAEEDRLEGRTAHQPSITSEQATQPSSPPSITMNQTEPPTWTISYQGRTATVGSAIQAQRISCQWDSDTCF
jgi:hypothetical protein